jgi:hypothetical protein
MQAPRPLTRLRGTTAPDVRGNATNSATILCKGGLDVIRKETWPFYRTISGVRLCWELGRPKGPEGPQPRTFGVTRTIFNAS